MKTLLTIAFLLIGCGPAQMPHQTQAVQLVWNGMFGQNDEPPEIDWWDTRCPTDPSPLTAVVADGICYSGLSYGDWLCDVAWRGSYDVSAFAHELMHAKQGRHGIIDLNHTITADWDLVNDANMALKQIGL